MSRIEHQNKTEEDATRSQMEQVPYPKHVYLIVANKCCERASFYGLTTILVRYLKNKLYYSENGATALYHAFLTTVYVMCIFGGIVSDVWWGNFKTILILSFTYLLGFIILLISSTPLLSSSTQIASIVGLILIATSAGGVQPCLSSFGADQFKLPEQQSQIVKYFSAFYFGMSVGTLFAIVVTPILKENVQCFDDDGCFPLAFGYSAVFMIISIVVFVLGKSSYRMEKTASECSLFDVLKCISNAITTKCCGGTSERQKNLLDYSIDKYGHKLVDSTRSLLRVFALYLPLPIYWALYDQQTSRWIFQASKTNGDIGFITIIPDQIPLLSPFLLLVFIPLFDTMIYPLLARMGLRRPLQKMAFGGIMAAIAFLCSALVQFQIESMCDQKLSMLWLVPQYVCITISEVMLVVTGYTFSYEQAPSSMKSVVQAVWLLNRAFGDLIILFMAKFSFVNSQAHEFLLLSAVMTIGMAVFSALAYNFKPN